MKNKNKKRKETKKMFGPSNMYIHVFISVKDYFRLFSVRGKDRWYPPSFFFNLLGNSASSPSEELEGGGIEPWAAQDTRA